MTNDSSNAVLYVECNTDGTIGGSYYSLLYLISALDRQIFRPVVVFEAPCRIASDFEATGATVIQLTPFVPTRSSRSFLRPLAKLANAVRSFVRWFHVLLRCLSILRRHDVKLVHINNAVSAGRSWLLAAKISGIPCVSHQRGFETGISAFGRFMARRLDAIVCISQAVKENLVSLGIRGVPMHMIHNALDATKVKVSRSAAEIRRELGVASSHPIIGIIGNLQRWKGQKLLVEAVMLLRASFSTLACVIVGDTASTVDDKRYAVELSSFIQASNLTDSVVIAGYHRDVANYMNAVDLVVHASVLAEPFGRVLLEAMALKKPLVASRAGGVLEIVVDGVSGLLFEPGNAEDLARALRSALSDTASAERMGIAGYERLLEEFSIAAHVRRIQEVYRAVMRSPAT
jgi:glycosyltransferase involved in cell wall biosynthesis